MKKSLRLSQPAWPGTLRKMVLSALMLGGLSVASIGQVNPCSSDTTPPTITACPANITVQTGTGNTCTKTVTWTAPTATDNCGPVTTSSTHQSGATFSKGTTLVKYTFTDAANNKSSCSFFVTINDNTPPVIAAMNNITVNNTPNLCGANVNFTRPSVTDNCPVCPMSIAQIVSMGYAHMGSFGGHEYFLSPIKGEQDLADSFARVIGGHLATISSRAEDSFIANTVGGTAWIGFTDRDSEGVFTWLNGEPVTYVNWCIGQPDNWRSNQNYTVIYGVGVSGPEGCWDDGHSPSNPDVGPNYFYGVIEVVGCSGVRQIAGLDSGSLFPIGVSTVTWAASDASGNLDSASFTITVVDNQPPAITCPANATVAFGGNTTPTAAGTGVATATDNCGIQGIVSSDASTQNSNPNAINHYNYTITRTWTATDVNGNTAACTQIITVSDLVPPTARCKNKTVFLNAAGAASIVPADVDNGSSDNASPVTLVSVVPSSFTCANTGSPVPVVLTVRDASGLTATCTAMVTVIDNTNPVLTTPVNVTVNYGANTSPTAAGTGLGTATDNCPPPVVTSTDVSTKSNNPATCSYYSYTITRTWKATDASNNSATGVQIITVRDVTPPVAICKPITVTLNASGTATITTAHINNGSSDNSGAIVLDSLSISTFTSAQAGTTVPVTLTVKDVCGNTSTCTASVTVVDNTPPAISCPAPKTVNYGSSTAPTAAGTGIATATDNCGTPVITSSDVSTQASSPNVCGRYNYTITRTWKATDSKGNFSTCTQLITVKDVTKPVAICKSVSVTLVNGVATITPAMVNNGSYDNSGVIASVTVSRTSFTCANIGANTVTLTVTDICGNSSTCTATVNVSGATCNCSIGVTPSSNVYTGGVPTNIYLGYGPQKATLNANPGGNGSFTYLWSGPTSTLSSTTSKTPVFTPKTAGNYTFTVTIRNSFGCTSTCSVTLCVKDIRVASNSNQSNSSNSHHDDDDDHHSNSYDDDDDNHKCKNSCGNNCSHKKSNNSSNNNRSSYCDSDDDDNNQNTSKVYLCHRPPGNPSNSQLLSISINAVAAHLSNHSGDQLGKCTQICGTNARMSAEEIVSDDVKIYPNPSTGIFTIELPYIEDKALIMISDMQGKTIQRKVVVDGDGNRIGFDLSGVARGVYLVDVVVGDQRVRTKLVVQ